MDLPKNITQIGVPDKKIKIYVEDYVVSYMKQFNLVAADKEMAIAMYGNRKKENDLIYLFIYGAIKLDLIQKETKHLSKTQMEEIQHSGQLHFPDHTFLAYCLLDGEMVEGMYVCEEDRANYVSGYAQFYEKNDKMLALLIESRGEKIKPEIVDLDKYEMVRRRQVERKTPSNVKEKTDGQAEEQAKVINKRTKFFNAKKRMAAGFVVVTLMGVFTYNSLDGQLDWRGMVKQVMENFGEQKLPDLVAASGDNSVSHTKHDEMIMTNGSDVEKAIKDPKATDADQGTTEMDQGGGETDQTTLKMDQVSEEGVPVSFEMDQMMEETGHVISEIPQVTEEGVRASVEMNTAIEEVVQTISEMDQATQEAEQVTSESVQTGVGLDQGVYIVMPGDTLNGISLRIYHTVNKVDAICSLNRIDNPDEIKEGQKIILP